MKVKNFDLNDGINPILHLEAKTVEERIFFNRLQMLGVKVVSWNGANKLSLTCGKKLGKSFINLLKWMETLEANLPQEKETTKDNDMNDDDLTGLLVKQHGFTQQSARQILSKYHQQHSL